jgi:hypothetical protein
VPKKKPANGGLKVQCTVDSTTRRILDEMGDLSLHGRNRAEVSAWILRSWIWDNQERLERNGILIRARV